MHVAGTKAHFRPHWSVSPLVIIGKATGIYLTIFFASRTCFGVGYVFLGAFESETEPIDVVVMAALAKRKARLCLTPPNAATRAQETYV